MRLCVAGVVQLGKKAIAAMYGGRVAKSYEARCVRVGRKLSTIMNSAVKPLSREFARSGCSYCKNVVVVCRSEA